MCVCSLWYPACNAHSPYCHLWPVRLYRIFPHYLINGTIFGKKVIEHQMCVLIFSATIVWKISHYKTKKMYIGLHVKYPLWSCLILLKLKISQQFSKNIQTQNFMGPYSVGADLFHADGQTDRQTDKTRQDEAIIAFRNVAKAPEREGMVSTNCRSRNASFSLKSSHHLLPRHCHAPYYINSGSLYYSSKYRVPGALCVPGLEWSLFAFHTERDGSATLYWRLECTSDIMA